MDEKFFTSRDVTRILGITERQAIDWSSRAIVKPRVDARGAGSRRIYDFENLIEFTLTKTLLAWGLQVHRVREILDAMRTTMQWRALLKEMPEWEKETTTLFNKSLFICFRPDESLELSFPQNFKELKEHIESTMTLMGGKGGIIVNLFEIKEQIKKGFESIT